MLEILIMLEISIEEYYEQLNALNTDIDACQQENKRLLDITSALEEFIDSLDSDAESNMIDPNTFNLINNVALAGTDAVSEETILPSLESFNNNPEIALEGILDKIQELTEVVTNNFSEATNKLLAKNQLNSGFMKSSRAKIEERIDSSKNRKFKKNFTITSYKSLVQNNQPIKTKEQLITAIERDSSLLNNISSTIDVEVHNFDKMVRKTLIAISTSGYLEQMVANYEVLNDFFNSIVRKNSFKQTNNSAVSGKEYTSPSLVGGKTIVITTPGASIDTDSTRAEIRSRLSKFNIFTFNNTELSSNKTLDLTNFTSNDLNKLENAIEKHYKSIEVFQSSLIKNIATIRSAYSLLNNAFNAGRGAATGYILSEALFEKMSGIMIALGKTAPSAVKKLLYTSSGALTGAAVGYATSAIGMWITKQVLSWLSTTIKMQYVITELLQKTSNIVTDLNSESLQLQKHLIEQITKERNFE